MSDKQTPPDWVLRRAAELCGVTWLDELDYDFLRKRYNNECEYRAFCDTIEAQAAEIERLREALRGMIDYSCYSERWQDDHPEYVAAARAALGETE